MSTNLVIFDLDGEEIQNSMARTHLWFTTTYADGNHDLTITAYDKAGNSAESMFQFMVDNTEPMVEITDPDNGEKIDGFGMISVDSEDTPGGSGVALVRFFFNGLIQYTDSEVPFEFEFHSDDSVVHRAYHRLPVGIEKTLANVAHCTELGEPVEILLGENVAAVGDQAGRVE